MARSEWALGFRKRMSDGRVSPGMETQDEPTDGPAQHRVVGAGVRVQLGGPERAQMIATYSHVRRNR